MGVDTGERALSGGRPRRIVDSRARDFVGVFGIVLVAAGLFAVFATTASTFAHGANLRNILIQTSVLGVVAIGETLVMLQGGIDLSVGAVVLLSSVIVAGLTSNLGVPLAVAIPAALGAGAAIGLLNGLLSAVVGIESILVTLGSLMVASGLGQILLHNAYLQVDSKGLEALAQTHGSGLPIMVWVMIALYALTAFVAVRTPFGRRIYHAGGNPLAAGLVGVAVTRLRVLVFALAGVFAAVGGILEAGQLGIISQNDGAGMEFNAITAVLIGGLSVASGGVGRLEKTLLGALVVGMITNYLTIRGVPGTYQQAVLGGLILTAVLLDHAIRRQRA